MKIHFKFFTECNRIREQIIQIVAKLLHPVEESLKYTHNMQ